MISITAYDPSGGLSAATLGNGFTETRAYTPRTWLGSIYVKNGSTPVYSLYGPDTGNLIKYAGNGNVMNVTDSVNGTWAYTYNGVNRLNTAVATGHNFQYTDDAYGNMTCVDNGSQHSPCTPSNPGLTISPSNNRITNSNYAYDNNGNLLTTNGLMRGMVYDTENRLTCVIASDGSCTSTTPAAATNYYYYPDGTRAAKWQGQWGQPGGALLEDYVYDFSGNQVSAHNSSGILRNELYAPTGRHVATYGNSLLTYNFADWLGTERYRVNPNYTETCIDTPYGMNLACAGGDTSPMHFTGKQSDAETGLDYFGARYNSPTRRFMSRIGDEPEPVPYADLEDPQTLNLYSYVGNNPLATADVDGHCAEDACVVEGTAVLLVEEPWCSTRIYLSPPLRRVCPMQSNRRATNSNGSGRNYGARSGPQTRRQEKNKMLTTRSQEPTAGQILWIISARCLTRTTLSATRIMEILRGGQNGASLSRRSPNRQSLSHRNPNHQSLSHRNPNHQSLSHIPNPPNG